MDNISDANVAQIITAATALLSSLVGALAGGLTTYLVQSRLARSARNTDRGAIAAMFIADIRTINEWLEKTNLPGGIDALRPRLTEQNPEDWVDAETKALFRIISQNMAELDDTFYRRHSINAGSLGVLAVNVAAFYSALTSLKSNLIALAEGLYDAFPTHAKLGLIGTIQGEIAVLTDASGTIEPKLLELIN